MKIGDKVHCTKYVERRRQGISVMDYSPFVSILDEGAPRKEVVYYDTEKRETVSIPYNEFTDATIDKFKTIEKEFDGIYVGTTHLTTKLSATYEEWGGGDFIEFRSKDVKKFAVVYYGNNKKDLFRLIA
jgi:hypothetical protein